MKKELIICIVAIMLIVGIIIGYQFGWMAGQKDIIYRVSKTMKCVSINEEFNDTRLNMKPQINLSEWSPP